MTSGHTGRTIKFMNVPLLIIFFVLFYLFIFVVVFVF